tara:strand:+ start:214 stop:1413 length:1200 start_codon:yes stop_codon:yes gene_type:complete
MFIASVVCGRSKDYGTSRDSSLKRPPVLESDATKLYHSVNSTTAGEHHRMWVVYSPDQAYPRYVLTYTSDPNATSDSDTSPVAKVALSELGCDGTLVRAALPPPPPPLDPWNFANALPLSDDSGRSFAAPAASAASAGSSGSSSTATGPLVVGDKVRVKSSVSKPSHGWGSVKAGDVGTLTSISGTGCTIKFPKQSGWSGKVAEIERVGGGGGGAAASSGSAVTDANKKVGLRVKRGPAWKWSQQDGGGPGVISKLDSKGWVGVKWDKTGNTNSYRTNHADLVFVGAAPAVVSTLPGATLTVSNAKVGIRVHTSKSHSGKTGAAKLMGWKVAGKRSGDTSGGLSSDNYCRVDFDSGGPWNVSRRRVLVLSPGFATHSLPPCVVVFLRFPCRTCSCSERR